MIIDALESVHNQTFNNIEYIVVDGDSTDGTREILYKNREKISVLISAADDGIYDAMNKGIAASSGEIIGILNSDDLYYNEKILSIVMDQFIQNDNLDAVYGDLVYVLRRDVNSIRRKWISGAINKNYFERGNVPAHPTLFLRRSVYDRVGMFNLIFPLASDYEFMLRIFHHHKVKSKYLNIIMVKMRLGGATNKSFKNIILQNIEVYKSWRLNGYNPPVLLLPYRILNRLKQFFC